MACGAFVTNLLVSSTPLTFPRLPSWGMTGEVLWLGGLASTTPIVSMGLSVNTYLSLSELVQAEPKFEYQLKYANPASTAGMDATVGEVYRTIQAKFGSMDDEDREYVVGEYKHSGFRGPLNYYKTTLVNFFDEIGLHKGIDLPCWIILAYDDPFLPVHLVYQMADYMPKLKIATIWARHFVISEKPNETNAVLKQCLDDMSRRRN
ncbi:hypothetical protein BGZ93_009272 [Podila epicladia]|nr:hypothetical protein BGZ92_009954 [Podila epicladia]KAG0099078.1 hypothetical protein BGZ93_009272 [Podila epicladia]